MLERISVGPVLIYPTAVLTAAALVAIYTQRIVTHAKARGRTGKEHDATSDQP